MDKLLKLKNQILNFDSSSTRFDPVFGFSFSFLSISITYLQHNVAFAKINTKTTLIYCEFSTPKQNGFLRTRCKIIFFAEAYQNTFMLLECVRKTPNLYVIVALLLLQPKWGV